MRGLEEQAFGVLAQADTADTRAAADESHIRRVVRELRRRQIELAIRPASTAPSTPRRPWPRWAYAAAGVAAAIFIVLGLFATGIIELPIRNGPIAGPNVTQPTDEIVVSSEPAESKDPEVRELQRSIVGMPAIYPSASATLDNIEAQVRSLRDDDPF